MHKAPGLSNLMHRQMFRKRETHVIARMWHTWPGFEIDLVLHRVCFTACGSTGGCGVGLDIHVSCCRTESQ
jgi:hypothetical protein